jgi:hypothetical protein
VPTDASFLAVLDVSVSYPDSEDFTVNWLSGPKPPFTCDIQLEKTVTIQTPGIVDPDGASATVDIEMVRDTDGDGIPDDGDFSGKPNDSPCDSGEGAEDACDDNCQDDPNPGQENTDGDAWGDVCDNCPTKATPWWVPPGDTDCDGFTDIVEGVTGTDPADDCPDWTGTPGQCPGPTCDGDDCWPVDLDVNRTVNVLDILYFKPVLGGPYNARYDFNGDSAINVIDILLFKPSFGTTCTNP